jgi:acyl carrier protein
MDDIRAQVQEVFRQVFDEPELQLRDDTAIAGIPGWDSMTHLSLMIAMERRFHIKLALGEMSRLKGPGENVGTLIALIGKKAV